ncbi:MAG: glycosyltransferase family 61 protein [Bacteroidota bacterium]
MLVYDYVDGEGYVFDRLRVFDFSHFMRKPLPRSIAIRHIWKSVLTKPKTKIAKAIWVNDVWGKGYFHWFADVLHRYYQIYLQSNELLPMMLPAEYANYPYITESLRALRIEAIWVQKDELIQVSELLTIDFLYCPGTFTVRAMRALREDILSRLGTETQSPVQQAIYISRAKARMRKVSNEAEVLEVLLTQEIEQVHMETMSWSQQIRTLRSANILIGMHGAGLTNMMWMPYGSHIIELRMEGSEEQWAYYEMAATFGHHYHYLICEPEQPGARPHDGNVRVDIPAFEQLLASVLNTAE